MLTLKEIYKLNLSSKETLLLINDFVSELIPVFHSSPYIIKKGDTVESLYERFKKQEIGGWCGLFTEYMIMLLDKCGISAYEFNYGLRGTEFTHTVVIADGYLLDPYFNKYYIDKEGQLIGFEYLLQKITNQSFSFLSVYGASVKTKRIDKAEGHEFISLTGQEWEKFLINSWKQKSFYEIMESEFGGINPYFLMLKKI